MPNEENSERPTKNLLTLAEVAVQYHCSERTLKGIIREHGIPVLRPGRTILFDAVALAAFCQAVRCGPEGTTRAPSNTARWRPAAKPSKEYLAALKLTSRSERGPR